MTDERFFIPWRALKPGVFWPFLIIWNLLCLLAWLLNRGHGGTFTLASSMVAVGALALALAAVLLLLLSARAQAAALRHGQEIEACRTQLWGIAVTLGFLIVAFSVQALAVL